MAEDLMKKHNSHYNVRMVTLQLDTLAELQRLYDEVFEIAEACRLDHYATSEDSGRPSNWRKKRSHFEFMLNVYSRLQKHRGVADPLEIVARELSDEVISLWLDEFIGLT